MAPVPSPTVCVEKQRLTKAFIKAVSEYHRMQSAQIAALRNGDGFQFEELLGKARKARDASKRALLQHENEHGC
jgi:hypothetical protein